MLRRLACALAPLFLIVPLTMNAQTLAYTAPVQPGNQNVGGTTALGVDFNVTASVFVTSVCAFDAAGNGFTNPVTVAIYNRTTGVVIPGTSATFTSATPGTLTNGYRCQTLATAVMLQPGQYTVVATGYNTPDLNGNSSCVGNAAPSCLPSNAFTAPTFNGGTSLTAAGYRFGLTANPTTMTPDAAGTTYLAGSFAYQAAVAPTLVKSFSSVAIPLGGGVHATITVNNPNPGPLTVTITDVLPTGLAPAPLNLTGTCGIVNPFTVPAGGSCSLSFDLLGSAEGSILNSATAIATGIPGVVTATARIAVGATFGINYAANLNLGDAYINMTNTGVNGAPLLGPGFGGAAGNICVNLYSFSPDEQLVSCCSCLVTPNALNFVSVNTDLTSKTLTGVVPTSLVVKLVVTGTGADQAGAPTFTGSSCTNSAAMAGAGFPLAPGLGAWGTSVHNGPAGVPLGITEKPVRLQTLSASELASITGRCAAILGNGSGFGVCRSCRAGALGAIPR